MRKGRKQENPPNEEAETKWPDEEGKGKTKGVSKGEEGKTEDRGKAADPRSESERQIREARVTRITTRLKPECCNTSGGAFAPRPAKHSRESPDRGSWPPDELASHETETLCWKACLVGSQNYERTFRFLKSTLETGKFLVSQPLPHAYVCICR